MHPIGLLAESLFGSLNSPVFYREKIEPLCKEISRPLKRWPERFEKDLSGELCHFIGHLDGPFTRPRDVRHLARLFCSSYLMRKSLSRALYFAPYKRHVKARLIQTELVFPFQSQPALGILAAISLQDDEGERFRERHMGAAILAACPQAEILKGSFYAYQSYGDPIPVLYLEIVKKDGSRFSLKEKKQLARALPEELAKRVERTGLISFDLHREEEAVKNLALLKKELSAAPDLPQAMIFFAAQTPQYLSFKIILARTIRKAMLPLAKCFASLPLRFIVDRTNVFRNVEASIFQLRLPIDSSFLRADLSVNLYQARHDIVSLLQQAIGKVRDYNGGVFAQERDRFEEFKRSFPRIAKKDPDLLDRFFHAISPGHMQALLPLSALRSFFCMFQKILKENLTKKEDLRFQFRDRECFFEAMIRTEGSSFKQHLAGALKDEDWIGEDLATISLVHEGSHILGYLYYSHRQSDRSRFRQILRDQVRSWQKKAASFQSVRLTEQDLPVSLDPRISGDNIAERILGLLFEGLTRMGRDKKPECALAEKIEISPDGKSYLFILRRAFWNNGDRVTAQDFSYAWKKILSPNFFSRYGYLLYPIKNAKAVKEGKIGIEDIGIEVVDVNTLRVELEHPCPYFLEITAHALCFPVNERIDILNPQWPCREGEGYVCNGPFQLERNGKGHYELVKNPFYWEFRRVKLDQILIVQASGPVAMELFKKGQVDLVRCPISSRPALLRKGFDTSAQKIPTAAVAWLFINTKKIPFNNVNIRRALAAGLVREELSRSLGYPGASAFSPMLAQHRKCMDRGRIEKPKEQAKLLFARGLEELKLHPSEIPPFTIISHNQEIRRRTTAAIQQQWSDSLNISCRTEGYSWEDLFQRISNGNFEIALAYWCISINHPMATLNIFRYSTNSFSNWEHIGYQKLLQNADQEYDAERRSAYFAAAEKILIEEVPVIPLFDEHRLYFKNKNLVLDSGFNVNADFSSAYFEEMSK